MLTKATEVLCRAKAGEFLEVVYQVRLIEVSAGHRHPCPIRFLGLTHQSPHPLRSQHAAEHLRGEADLSGEHLAEPPLAYTNVSGDISHRSACAVGAKPVQSNHHRGVPFSRATQAVREDLFHDPKPLSMRADNAQTFPKLKARAAPNVRQVSM